MTTSILQDTRNLNPPTTAEENGVSPSRVGAKKKRTSLGASARIDSPSTHNSLDNRKLRASCDGCYLAKIKCSKERPKCSRCASHDTSCQYSPSQRIGKPRRLPPSNDNNVFPKKAEHSSASAAAKRRHSHELNVLSLQEGEDGMDTEESNDEDSGDVVTTPLFEWPFNLTPPTSETSGSEQTPMPLTPGLSFAWNQAIYLPHQPQPHQPQSHQTQHPHPHQHQQQHQRSDFDAPDASSSRFGTSERYVSPPTTNLTPRPTHVIVPAVSAL